LLAGSVPIYSGNPRVAEIFNPKAFINVDDFASDEDAIDYIRTVDNDTALYQSYVNQPPFRGNIVPERISDDAYVNFFRKVLG
jgi:alpha(1,3/1,4) fucosyltransferase